MQKPFYETEIECLDSESDADFLESAREDFDIPAQ